MPTETHFTSHGARCAAWRLTATSDRLATRRGRPCVVMAHGFGATRDSGLLPFAERFAEAGTDVLLFDYRGFGTSEGTPRQHVSHRRHRQDYHAAIAYARNLDGVDPERIVAWGSSYSGGHVVAVAAADPRVAAVISQGAAMDGFGSLLEIGRYAGVGQVLKLTAHGLRDAVGALVGRPPHLVPLVGEPGTLAAMSAADSASGYAAIAGPTFRNEMPARGLLGVALNRPVRVAGRLRCPILLIVAERDTIAPPSGVHAVAARAGERAEVHTYPSGHFDIYLGDVFDKSVSAQVDFLVRTLG